MEAHYDFQIKSHNHPTTQQNATFCGPARQMGAGAVGLGAFAMRMGRVAIPVARKYILPVAKHIGKYLLEAGIPEIGQVLAGKKRPNSKMLKHAAETAAEKSLRKFPSVLSGGAPLRAEGQVGDGGRRSDAARDRGCRPTVVKRQESKEMQYYSSTIIRNIFVHIIAEKQSVLINYEGSDDQEVFPHVGCRGPQ